MNMALKALKGQSFNVCLYTASPLNLSCGNENALLPPLVHRQLTPLPTLNCSGCLSRIASSAQTLIILARLADAASFIASQDSQFGFRSVYRAPQPDVRL